MRLLLVLGLLAPGCQVVFPFDRSCEIGHDEDADGVDDGCDNCPGTANPTQDNDLERTNGEVEDALGDACDPNPGLGGDVIVRFDSFTEEDVATRWEFGASWSFDGESLTFDGESVGRVLDNLPHPTPPFVIEYGVSIDGDYATINDNHIFLSLDGQLFDRRGATCGLTYFDDISGGMPPDPDPASGSHTTYVDSGPPPARNGDAARLADSIVAGDRVRIVATYDRVNIDCAVIEVGSSGAPVSTGFELVPPLVADDSSRLGFQAITIPQRLEYLIVYGR